MFNFTNQTGRNMSEQELNIHFEYPKQKSSIIKVIGVGGGGSNAVNHMYAQGITGVDFVVCNTDQQALDASPIPNKLQLGLNLTEGRGAGSKPDVGRQAAEESIENIHSILETNTKMVFITAGMGGGTGTGAAPVIAKAAKEMGVLTVGIVTIPFAFEGRKRIQQAELGISELRKNVDSILVINNEKIRELYGVHKSSEAFGKANDVLTIAAKGIAEIITVTGHINVDFEDVKTVMKDSGVAIMGTGMAEGENRALNAVEEALVSPLLNDNQIIGAKNILLNIGFGEDEITMDEISEITEYIQNAAGMDADVIWGYGYNNKLGNAVSVTVIATGFEQKPIPPVEKIILTSEKINQHTELSIKPEEDFKIINKQVNSEIAVSENTNTYNQQETIQVEQTRIVRDLFADDSDTSLTNTDFSLSIKEDTEYHQEVSIKEPEIQKQISSETTTERTNALRGLNFDNSKTLEELENLPAYLRKGIPLSSEKSSSEPLNSRMSLREVDDNKIEIRKNNPFLHDNVD